MATPRTTSARAGVQFGGAAVVFLVVYVTLQLLNALGRDPTWVAALTPIPLFARAGASVACAVPTGLALGHLVRDHQRWLQTLPALLAAAIALFVIAIALLS